MSDQDKLQRLNFSNICTNTKLNVIDFEKSFKSTERQFFKFLWKLELDNKIFINPFKNQIQLNLDYKYLNSLSILSCSIKEFFLLKKFFDLIQKLKQNKNDLILLNEISSLVFDNKKNFLQKTNLKYYSNEFYHYLQNNRFFGENQSKIFCDSFIKVHQSKSLENDKYFQEFLNYNKLKDLIDFESIHYDEKNNKINIKLSEKYHFKKDIITLIKFIKIPFGLAFKNIVYNYSNS